MDEKLKEQVAQQCKVVAHLATALAQVHSERAEIIAAGGYEGGALLDMVGRQTARLMETLGDILNGMDATDEDEDAWVDPVFKEAHRRWPDLSPVPIPRQ